MALIKCEECGKEISSRATACPFCGCPIETNSVSLIVKREANIFNGSAINLMVYCDGQLIGPVANGNSVKGKISPGTHVIMVAPSGERTNCKSGQKEILVSANCNEVTLAFRVSMGALSGYVNFTSYEEQPSRITEVQSNRKLSEPRTEAFIPITDSKASVEIKEPQQTHSISCDNQEILGLHSNQGNSDLFKPTDESIKPTDSPFTETQDFENSDNADENKSKRKKKVLKLLLPVVAIVVLVTVIVASSISNNIAEDKLVNSYLYIKGLELMQDNFSQSGDVTVEYDKKSKTIIYSLKFDFDYYSELKNYGIDKETLNELYDSINSMTYEAQKSFNNNNFDVNIKFMAYDGNVLLFDSCNGEIENSIMDEYAY